MLKQFFFYKLKDTTKTNNILEIPELWVFKDCFVMHYMSRIKFIIQCLNIYLKLMFSNYILIYISPLLHVVDIPGLLLTSLNILPSPRPFL